MNETFRGALGRKLISRASAEELGSVSDYLLDPSRRMISAVIVGHGRKASLVDWDNVAGFGPDAVMVSDDSALRAPADERERLACEGKLDLLGRRALTSAGNELGTVDDVVFTVEDGLILTFVVGGKDVPGEAMLGLGSYAVVLSGEASG